MTFLSPPPWNRIKPPPPPSSGVRCGDVEHLQITDVDVKAELPSRDVVASVATPDMPSIEVKKPKKQGLFSGRFGSGRGKIKVNIYEDVLALRPLLISNLSACVILTLSVRTAILRPAFRFALLKIPFFFRILTFDGNDG